MVYDTLYDWMRWLSAASIVGGLWGFLLLVGSVLRDGLGVGLGVVAWIRRRWSL